MKLSFLKSIIISFFELSILLQNYCKVFYICKCMLCILKLRFLPPTELQIVFFNHTGIFCNNCKFICYNWMFFRLLDHNEIRGIGEFSFDGLNNLQYLWVSDKLIMFWITLFVFDSNIFVKILLKLLFMSMCINITKLIFYFE